MRLPRTNFRDPVKGISLIVFVLLTVLSCINPYDTEYIALQHVPTVISLLLLILLDRRWPFDRTTYLCALGILLLHVLGARYLYSFVPYDRWTRDWLGFSIQETFGWKRNHYDRLVHFVYGVLMGLAMVRWLPMHFLRKRRWAGFLAVNIVLSTSCVYELLEWLIAAGMAPDWAESFNGQQGDMWDAHKDMALALAGALLSVTLSYPFWGTKVEAEPPPARLPPES